MVFESMACRTHISEIFVSFADSKARFAFGPLMDEAAKNAAARFNIMFPSFSNQSEHIKDQQSPMRHNAIRHFRNIRHQHIRYGRCI